MTLISGPKFAERLRSEPAEDAALLKAMVSVQKRLHAADGSRLPSLTGRLRADIRRTHHLEEALRRKLLAKLDVLEHGSAVCHGDVHPANILGETDSPIVVDWLDASCGPPEADACRTCLLMQAAHPALAAAYRDAFAGEDPDTRTDMLAWRSVIAAARLAEDVPHETERLKRLASDA